MRLLADDAVAADFLHLAISIGDHPVAADQAGRHIAVVGNRNRIRKYVAIGVGLRLLVDVVGGDLNQNFAVFLAHGAILTYSPAGHSRRLQSLPAVSPGSMPAALEHRLVHHRAQ